MPYFDAILVLNGEEYALDPDGEWQTFGDDLEQQEGQRAPRRFEIRWENAALGFGHSRFMEPGTYDYGDPAILHKRLSWLPGCAVTNLSLGATPIGPGSWVEFWDGTFQRIYLVTPRHVFEILPDGSIITNDLGAGFTAANGMTYGVAFKNSAMANVDVFFARRSFTSTDYMVRRDWGGTYALSPANKTALAIAAGKDQTGDDVLWRVSHDGRLNQCVAGADPDLAGSWAAATYGIGSTGARATMLINQSKRLLVLRDDGIQTFDNVARSTPLLPMTQAIDLLNGRYAKLANGMAIIPTVQGLICLDGLDWSYCGPISSNAHARNRRMREVAVSSQVGDFIYAAGYDGTDSYIWVGTPRTEKSSGSGSGPFVWHGPIAKVANEQVSDVEPSSVLTAGKRLFIAWQDGAGTIPLDSTWAPTPSATSGSIYAPEGMFDRGGPHVTKNIQSVEYVTPRANAMDANNTWTALFDVGSGYESIGAGNSGSYQKRTFSTEKSHKRPLLRLDYTSNGTAELEALIIRGWEQHTRTRRHIVPLILAPNIRKPSGAKIHRSPQAMLTDLEGLAQAGWKGAVIRGNDSLNVEVNSVDVTSYRETSRHEGPTIKVQVELSEVPT